MTGAPTTIPTANAEIRYPTCGTLTRRSALISGSNPTIMNSLVPSAKIPSASTATTRGTRARRTGAAALVPITSGTLRRRPVVDTGIPGRHRAPRPRRAVDVVVVEALLGGADRGRLGEPPVHPVQQPVVLEPLAGRGQHEQHLRRAPGRGLERVRHPGRDDQQVTGPQQLDLVLDEHPQDAVEHEEQL